MKRLLSIILTAVILAQPVYAKTPYDTASRTGMLKYLGSYSVGKSSANGGAAEIVKYNKDNKYLYVVTGLTDGVDIVDMSKIERGKENSFSKVKKIDMNAMTSSVNLSYGDVTSIDINTDSDLVTMCVQAAEYNKNGAVFFTDYDGNYISHYEVGNQPDMVTFTPDGKKVLVANEGEAREGYDSSNVDPEGSVSIIDISKGVKNATVTTADFVKYDNQISDLIKNNVLIKTGSKPSLDFEPEYICVSDDSKYAYVTIQENNAIGTIDIEKGEFIKINGLGFKDFSKGNNKLDLIKDKSINIKNQNVYGAYMPDGIATFNQNGTQYVVFGTEGDWRVWGSYCNYEEIKIDGEKVRVFTDDAYQGLDSSKTYIFGGRSFVVCKADTMEMVYESGCDFETITSQGNTADYFNSSNDKVELDNRSGKKGPEPEDAKVLKVNDKIYAFISIERTGGLMMYDVTNPSSSKYVDYITTRDYSSAIKKDVGPEGLCTLEGSLSPTGYPLVFMANEVSGTVSVYEVQEKDNNAPEQPTETTTTATSTTTETTTEVTTNNNFLYGDVNSDGVITSVDAANLLQYILNSDSMNLTDEQLKAGEITGDSTLTASDAAGILSKVLNDDYNFKI